MSSRPGCALCSVLYECDSATVQQCHEVIVSGVIEPSAVLFRRAVRRGSERGDARAANATDDMVRV
jgi:hypothetical protein